MCNKYQTIIRKKFFFHVPNSFTSIAGAPASSQHNTTNGGISFLCVYFVSLLCLTHAFLGGGRVFVF